MYAEFRNKMEKIIAKNCMSDDEIKDFSDFFTHKYQENKNGFKLYRYMTTNYDNIRNLEKEVIYLSDNGVMNDIYEGIPKFSKKDFTYNEIRALDDIMFMKCFSETNNNPLMWGHYADGTKGFCVEYDLSYIDVEKENEIEFLEHIFPVVYSEHRFVGEGFERMIDEKKYLDNEIFENSEPDDHPWLRDIYCLFLSKGKEWEYEKEWRILYNKYELYKNYLDWQKKREISFPFTSAVYLGAKMEEKYKEHIRDIVCKLNSIIKIPRNNIKIYEMNLSDNKFEFKFNELKQG